MKTALPISGLLALAMTGFIAIMTETLPAGLLPQISHSLNISPSLAGQLVTAYALGSLLAAIPLTALTRSWRRRPALMTAIIGFLAFNTLTAFSSNLTVIMLARFMAGAAAGLAWGLLAGYARRMVPESLQGKAMAIAMVGAPVALAIGVPLGTWLGSVVTWQTVFGLISVLTLMLTGWVMLKVPDFPGQLAKDSQPVGKVLTTPGVRPILFVIVVWVFAHNTLYTYIAPLLGPAGLTSQVDKVLLVFGLSALGGIWIVGAVVDAWLRRAVLLSLTGFALAVFAWGLYGSSPVVVYASIILWGITFGGAPALLQTASADATGENADIAQSMIVVAWNMAIAGGGITGGLLLQHAGIGAFPWAALALVLVGLVTAWKASTHGFKAGARGIYKTG
ncbi:MFS transporter [Enterobacterales bacterium]|nr:MFS transporter [Enterobacterales bacterium]